MKAKVFIYNQNNYDGSSSACFFNTEEDAEKYAEEDTERFCDDINSHTFEFDDQGNLLNSDKRDPEDEDDALIEELVKES
jgi:hypothetical protein